MNGKQRAHGQKQAKARGQKQRLAVGSLEARPVSRSETLRDQNSEALRNPLYRSENKIQIPVNTAQRSQRVHADSPAHNK